MSVSGWEAIVALPVKQIVTERMIDEDGHDALGDTVKTEFWTRSLPVTTNAGVTTDDETLVSVYLDGVIVASADYTLTGADGKIVFDSAPGLGVVITVTYYTALTVGYAQNVTMSHAGGLEEVYAIGSRSPREIKEGKINIALKMQRCYVDRNLFGKVSQPGVLPEFDVAIYTEGIGSGLPYFTATGKFEGYDIPTGQGAVTMENVGFKGRIIAEGLQA